MTSYLRERLNDAHFLQSTKSSSPELADDFATEGAEELQTLYKQQDDFHLNLDGYAADHGAEDAAREGEVFTDTEEYKDEDDMTSDMRSWFPRFLRRICANGLMNTSTSQMPSTPSQRGSRPGRSSTSRKSVTRNRTHRR